MCYNVINYQTAFNTNSKTTGDYRSITTDNYMIREDSPTYKKEYFNRTKVHYTKHCCASHKTTSTKQAMAKLSTNPQVIDKM